MSDEYGYENEGVSTARLLLPALPIERTGHDKRDQESPLREPGEDHPSIFHTVNEYLPYLFSSNGTSTPLFANSRELLGNSMLLGGMYTPQ